MKYSIEYSTLHNPKELKKIAKAHLRAIKFAIEGKLTRAPETFGKPLRFSLRGHRSLRVGDYSVIYRFQGATVHILLIAHRSEVYKEST